MEGDKNQPVLEAFPDITTSLADQESYCVLSLVLSFFRPTSGPDALLPLVSILVPGCWVNPFIPLGGFFLHSTPSTNLSVLHFHCCLKCQQFQLPMRFRMQHHDGQDSHSASCDHPVATGRHAGLPASSHQQLNLPPASCPHLLSPQVSVLLTSPPTKMISSRGLLPVLDPQMSLVST